ncbi:spore cortex biosynthesis protein YabQ [Mobilisporobacter senegalensis]|uniref:Spore cortex biosynthesis protein YabQ n=1 Tax=Mobilisporobacter senegalensis TaxID=1329262 RepID=A0A3N1XG22_9FIRM|nr:spore cortex biosynthesis protein YabQ [Mobilisporobacter senegalensis]ROR25670.1 spore cortex biosynthesis protein YabQ [Mobilisporobacter senegalensis]
MSDSIVLEVQFFLVSILSGAILLVVYDIIRIFRRIIRHSKFLVAIEDILFWVVSSVFIFIMMYRQNNGNIRGFSILGMVIGMLIYNQLLSSIVVNVSATIINKIIWVIKKIIMLILFPFRKVLGFIFRYVGRFLRFLKKKLRKLRINILKILKKFLKTVKIAVTKD